MVTISEKLNMANATVAKHIDDIVSLNRVIGNLKDTSEANIKALSRQDIVIAGLNKIIDDLVND